MSLKFLLDEHLRGMLWKAVQDHNAAAATPIDLICVGDDPTLPLGSDDEIIVPWAAEHDRILITRDKSTIPDILEGHLQTGRTSPGVFILKNRTTVRAIIDYLELVAEAGTEEEFNDCIDWIP